MDTTLSRTRRLPRGLRMLIGIVLGLALVVGGVVVVGQVRQALQTSELQDAVDQAYAIARPEADRRQAAGDAVLEGLLGPGRLRSSAVTCTLDHSDGGWMVTSWSQQCQIRTVDAFVTTLSYADLAARLQSATQEQGVWTRWARTSPEVDRRPTQARSPKGGCGALRTVGDGWNNTQQVVVTRLQDGSFHPENPDRDQVFGCQAPAPVYDERQTRIETSFAREAVTADRSWVIVERRTEFLEHDLGCAGLLFCSAPISAARLPRT